MAVYTTEIRSIVEQINADNNFTPSNTDVIKAIDERIDNARPFIFSFDYPISELDKERFEKNFIRHFYTREIGLETYSLWRLKLHAKLNLIMPKYNKLYDEAYKYSNYDLLKNMDYEITRSFSGTKTSEGLENYVGKRTDNLQHTDNGTNTRTDNLNQAKTGKDKDTDNIDRVRAYSDTPQGNMENLLNEKYLTNLTHEYERGSTKETDYNTEVKNTGTQTNALNSTKKDTGTVDNVGKTDTSDRATDTQLETIRHEGKNTDITFAEAILKARETYLNIDLMVCNELKDLFMMIW